jgi:hypothetical protein
MRFRFVAALFAALLSVSCGGVTSPSNNRIDPFSGTLAPGGSNQVNFSASNTGEFSVVITALTPVSNAVLGAYYGTQQNGGSSCAILSQGAGTLNQVLLSGSIIKGDYCILIYDYLGNLTANENYTLSISRP